MIIYRNEKDFSKLKIDVLETLFDFVEKHMEAGLKKSGFYRMGARYVKKFAWKYYDEGELSIRTPKGVKKFKIKITEIKK